MTEAITSVGVVGLAVMGSNLARNIARNGFSVVVHNRTASVTEEFMNAYGEEGDFHRADTLEALIEALPTPRVIVLMIKAGGPTDAVIDSLIPLLDKDDIIVDGGNAWFKDTEERQKKAAEHGIHVLGVGISGGEEGALEGPSIMPGGDKASWEFLAPVLNAISAKAGDTVCTGYVGPGGAGHFVKMVHNGIEYADMQLIAETYHMLSSGIDYQADQLAALYDSWNDGDLASYLVEITAEIFKKKDEDGDGYLIDKILDKAGQKGTGRWTAEVALELGVAVPCISAAVEARIMSAHKPLREVIAPHFPSPEGSKILDEFHEAFVRSVRDSFYASRILTYAQGFDLLMLASKEYGWDLKFDEILSYWKGGCIIRSTLLDTLIKAYQDRCELETLLDAPGVVSLLQETIPALRRGTGLAATIGVPAPCMSAALSYFDSMRHERLPQNLVQAQRDFFGAHTYERTDKEGSFHTQWEE